MQKTAPIDPAQTEATSFWKPGRSISPDLGGRDCLVPGVHRKRPAGQLLPAWERFPNDTMRFQAAELGHGLARDAEGGATTTSPTVVASGATGWSAMSPTMAGRTPA